MHQQDTQPPLREFLYHAYDQRNAAARLFGAVLATALAIAAMLPPSYRATATLAILPAPEFTVRAAAGSHELNASALAMDQIMKAETEILESDDLHAATLRKLGPSTFYPDTFAEPTSGLGRRLLHGIAQAILSPWRVTPRDPDAARTAKGLRLFRSDLDVLPTRDANVITVSFDNRDSVAAAAAVNTMLKLYAERRSRLYDDPQVEIVRRDAETSRAAASEAERKLTAFKRDHGISDYDQERSLLLARRSHTEQALADAVVARGESRARLVTLTAQLTTEPAIVGLYREQDQDTRLLAVNAALQDLRAKLAAARETYRDTSRRVTALRAQVASAEDEARRLAQSATTSVVREGRNPAIDPIRVDQMRAAAEGAAVQARVFALQAQAEAIAASVVRLDRDEAELAALQRQKASAEDDFRTASRILAERSLSEAEDTRRLANVRVIQAAMIPQQPRPIPLLVIAAGCVLSVLAALGWIICNFMLRPVFLTGEGLSAASGLPVLAVFTRALDRKPENLVSA